MARCRALPVRCCCQARPGRPWRPPASFRGGRLAGTVWWLEAISLIMADLATSGSSDVAAVPALRPAVEVRGGGGHPCRLLVLGVALGCGLQKISSFFSRCEGRLAFELVLGRSESGLKRFASSTSSIKLDGGFLQWFDGVGWAPAAAHRGDGGQRRVLLAILATARRLGSSVAVRFWLPASSKHQTGNFRLAESNCCCNLCLFGACSSYAKHCQLSGCYALKLLQATGHGDYACLFGTGRRWVRASLQRFLRFNSKDPPELSSVMHPQDLQLNPLPQWQLVEPLALRLARLQEAPEEYNCRFRASEFSTDPWQAPVVLFGIFIMFSR